MLHRNNKTEFKEQKMKLKKLFKKTVIIAAAVSVSMLISCAKETKNELFVSFFTGSVTQVRNGAQVAVEVKGLGKEGDIFTVGEKSTLILQSSDGLVIRFESILKL
jgi:hypothetical protein